MRLVLGTFALAAALVFASTGTAHAQESPWSADVSIGFDSGLSGNIHSSAIGTLVGQPAVIEERSFGDAYGTGIHFRIGAGYTLNERAEARAVFTYQSMGSDAIEVGTVGNSALFAEFDDYKSWSLEGGYRAYFSEAAESFRPYGEATVGFARLSAIDAQFALPNSGLSVPITEFYDASTTFTFTAAGGVLYSFNEMIALDGRIGLRRVGGFGEIDALNGSGLEDINDGTSRWSLPITVGARFKF